MKMTPSTTYVVFGMGVIAGAIAGPAGDGGMPRSGYPQKGFLFGDEGVIIQRTLARSCLNLGEI